MRCRRFLASWIALLFLGTELVALAPQFHQHRGGREVPMAGIDGSVTGVAPGGKTLAPGECPLCVLAGISVIAAWSLPALSPEVRSCAAVSRPSALPLSRYQESPSGRAPPHA